MAKVNGYVTIYCPNHPKAGSNGMVYEHIVKAEEKIHRVLKPQEVVHHIDGNRSNNSLDNLIVFASREDHTSYHQSGQSYFDDEGIAHSLNLKSNLCLRCGKKLSSRRCDYCSDCLKIVERKVKRPSRDELKELIRHNSFVSIGKKYHVTDNAIRKWCKLEKLPFLASEICKIPDEEWAKI